MADSRQEWDRVGKDLSDLGRRVRQHYQRQPGAEHQEPADRRKVEDALREVADSLDQAFTAIGDAVRDPEFGEATKKAANSLSDALSATFADLGLRRSGPDRGQRPPGAG
ncbi:MAG TPA: hypothetical protein VFD04_25275 [Actinomycetes bacterium]|jgi:hypothetical protein|nr:hypothetical protein [Actinomycetes bacterium]